MSVDTIHSASIPHAKCRPLADHVRVRIPSPPKKVGRLLVPDEHRDVAQHSVIAGEIEELGPLAFWVKQPDGTVRQEDVKPGDWCIFRPFAGTFMQPGGGGVVGAMGGFRYLSAHKEVIGVISAADMRAANPIWPDGTDPLQDAPAAPQRELAL